MQAYERIVIAGQEDGQRLDSRVLEERVQQAVAHGYLDIEVQAHGQHGIGGRLWPAADRQVRLYVTGAVGQRLGAMGFANTTIEVEGSASDDVGWLNAGAHIVIRGDATNGVGNAMAQGRILVRGDIGARGMTMTKHNPKYDPPELWVLGGVGDYFAEFMGGGVAVICGLGSRYRENILGQRPCVGMVGGRIFLRGQARGFSQADARLAVITDSDWDWLCSHMDDFLKAIGREDLSAILTADRDQWQLLTALEPHAKQEYPRRSMAQFREEVWDRELGDGGLLGDLTRIDRGPIEIVATGDLRRYVPRWNNGYYLPPCQAGCPAGIPVQRRWELIRDGRLEEACDLALAYNPLPATVCGYLCPQPCMQHCTREDGGLTPVDVGLLGRASLAARAPAPQAVSGSRIAVIGAGPAGLSVAWQLWLAGHTPVVYDRAHRLGGKIASAIPDSRIPPEILKAELDRIAGRVDIRELEHDLTEKDFSRLVEEHDMVVIAVGAQTPRMPPIEGIERATSALEFLKATKEGSATVGEHVVIIGAGNVGCDVASEAARLGASEITLIDIQAPAAFGREREEALRGGATFLWPVSARALTEAGVELADGRSLAAETVVIAIGDQPDLSFLPEGIATARGYIRVDENGRTTWPEVYAIGDSVRPGLLTDAIGAGRRAARDIDARLLGRDQTCELRPMIDKSRVKLEYYDPGIRELATLAECGGQCVSCGGCRDCGLCEVLCPQQAIRRQALEGEDYAYVVDEGRCIGCGFCAGGCPCGIWELLENEALE